MYFLRHIKSIIKDSKGLNFVEIFFLAKATLFLLGFSKYEFQNKLLGNVTLLRVIIYIYIYIYILKKEYVKAASQGTEAVKGQTTKKF